MRERSVAWGPTFEEMLDPELANQDVREEALRARNRGEMSPADLFNITWRDERGRIRLIRLPPELTGVEANILVLIGKDFPSGSLKIGPAYAAVMEAELDGRIRPGEVTLTAATSGNFGIGVAYVARLKGYRALVLMPEGCSEERRDRIREYGAEVDLVRCEMGNIEPVLHSVRERYASRPGYMVLDQFALMANYRFHRFVTGRSALDAAAGFGDGRVAAFVSAPGSAGTLAAGDEIKARFPDAIVVAVEPQECPTLATGDRGDHRIEGIADGLVNLIHNVLNTDYVVEVHDEDCLQGLRVVQEGPAVLTRILGVPEPAAEALVGLFGPSSICNILGAVRVAGALGIPAGRNVLTVAPDGFDRYPSAMASLEGRAGAVDQATLRGWAGQVFRGVDVYGLHDLRPAQEKDRLFRQKEAVWTRLGYGLDVLEDMKSPPFWEREYAKAADYDRRLCEAREG